MLKTLRNYWFIAGLFITAILAWFFSDWGKSGGLLKTEYSTNVAVFIIFLVQGFILPTEDILRGVKRHKFHLSLQAFMFLVCPVVIYILMIPLSKFLGEELQTGFLYLSILPTTISTSLLYSNRSGGSSVEALFNIVLANILAIFIVPTYMGWVLRGASGEFSAIPVILKIITYILLPLIIGQLIRPRLIVASIKHKSILNEFNSLLVLFIVFAAFSNSVAENSWAQQTKTIIIAVFCGALIAYVIIQLLALLFIFIAKLNYKDAVSFYFCGTMKSVAVGVPMASSIFGGAGYNVALIILPLIMYGMMEYIFGGLVVNHLQARAEAKQF
jgi:solute carrier family 10 (sodium/bile acid cotransporter), member 7